MSRKKIKPTPEQIEIVGFSSMILSLIMIAIVVHHWDD